MATGQTTGRPIHYMHTCVLLIRKHEYIDDNEQYVTNNVNSLICRSRYISVIKCAVKIIPSKEKIKKNVLTEVVVYSFFFFFSENFRFDIPLFTSRKISFCEDGSFPLFKTENFHF